MRDIPHFIEFNKNMFVQNVMELVEEQEIEDSELAWLFQKSAKTVKRYLNPDSSSEPRISEFSHFFQGVNTSPGYLLIGRGPRYIDPESAQGLFTAMEWMADPYRPSLKVSVHHVMQMEEENRRMLNKALAGLKSLDPAWQKKVLRAFLDLATEE